MKPVATRDQIIELLHGLCGLLNHGGVPYLVYGSAAYALITEDVAPINDIDIIVRERDFGRICELLNSAPELALAPSPTEFTVFANSYLYADRDGNTFYVSLDSREHYFAAFNLDLDAYPRNAEGLCLMTPEDLIAVYERNLDGRETEEKRREDERKVANLGAFVADTMIPRLSSRGMEAGSR